MTALTPIVFFGSGPVAAACLDLLQQHTIIDLVVTKPKLAHHKGPTPVLELATSLGLRIITPSSKSELQSAFEQEPSKAKLGIVIDYGIIISRPVIDYFPLGIINSHFSLLPEWRGADPLTFAILSGQRQTGISLMLIDEGMDTGNLIAQKPFGIPDGYTTAQLTDALISLSDSTLREILPQWVNGTIKPIPQYIHTLASSTEPTYSRKLSTADAIIDWRKPAVEIERQIRAFTPWPRSRTLIAGKQVVITKAHIESDSGKPGVAYVRNKDLAVYCGSESLIIDQIIPAGKKEMTGRAFLAGNKV